MSPHITPPQGTFDNSGAWTSAQRERARRGYAILAGYVRRMHEAGIRLAAGTDWLDPGRTLLAEIAVLHQAGLPMADALSIATLGSARAMERESEYGTIEPGRKAQLVIFERDPLRDPQGLFAGKIVVKDGRIVAGDAQQRR
jgi:imidazolonepropionase-like amidohydrolase